MSYSVRTESGMLCGLVMTSGTFDLLHVEHLQHLRECRAMGAALIVALNSDQSTLRRKGRLPVNDEIARRGALLATGVVDRVIIFDDPTPVLLIAAWKPQLFIVGSDYTPSMVAGREIIEAYGGRVICRTAPRTMSSSEIRERMEQLEKKRSVNAAS